MRGNSFGQIFTITTFGESHGDSLGVVIDGLPAGLKVFKSDLQEQLDRRRPGRLDELTGRNEGDQAQILSGVFEEKTLGTPICVSVKNTNQRSQDYDPLKNDYRPGHADKTTIEKFGFRDHRGGGRASGRETLARVIGGYFANLIIDRFANGTKIKAQIIHMGDFKADFNFNSKSKYGHADDTKDQEIELFFRKLKKQGDSIGGKVELQITNCPAGLGEPVFDKLKADLAKAMLSIGSCMGIQFGLGEEFASLLGSQISQNSKNFSGIEGGISNGELINCQLYFKAPSTIGEKAKAGRHDPCILPRVLPVVEAMAKIVIADHLLRQNAFQKK